MNPPPLLTARRALFPRCGAARTEHSPLFSSAERPGGSASDQGAAQGPGEVLFIFWALCRSTKTALAVSNFCRHYIRDVPEIQTGGGSWRLAQRAVRSIAMRGVAMAGAAAEEP